MQVIKFSIVVPCYNESANIPLILSRFEESINGRDDIEVVLVNNGSTDNSSEVFLNLLPRYTFANLVEISENKGYGFGIKKGLKSTTGKVIGWTHADMQTDPKDVVKAFDLIDAKNNFDLFYVKGDRKGRPFFDQFFTTGMSFFETLFMGVKLWDINAQPNVFSKKFFNSLENIPDDFSLDLYFLYIAKKKGLKIVRFDVVFPKRIHGESSWNTGFSAKWRFIVRTLKFSFKLKKQF